jgi:molybdopterin synthase catalytic subunit
VVGVRLTRRLLSVAAAYRELTDPACGGVVVFVGKVRPDRGRRGTVVALDYEADLRMARDQLEGLGRAAAHRYGARSTVLHHRLGRLPVGAISVIVGAAAPHRREAFAAARFLIERLKREVPIWKADRRRSGPTGRSVLPRVK